MYVKKGDGYISLLGVPNEYDVIVFGKYNDPDYEGYYAFLAPKETRLKPGTKIKGMRYAEGTKDSVDLLNNEVVTYRREDGGYNFYVKTGSSGNHFKLFPDSRGESTHEGSPTTVISFRLLD